MSRMTIKEFLDLKGKRQITAVNVEDPYLVSACYEAGIDNIVLGGITSIEEKKRLLLQTRSIVPDAFITAAIPFVSSVSSDESAIRDAATLFESGADLIYVTGMRSERIKRLARERIPCVGHLGLIPYLSTWTGGFRAVGKTAKEAMELFETALELEEAGVVCAEMECVPKEIASYITKHVSYITYSMGSGNGCDGQYMFSCDLLGLNNEKIPRHSISYDDFYGRAKSAFSAFGEDVKNGAYPSKKHTISINNEELEEFLNAAGR